MTSQSGTPKSIVLAYWKHVWCEGRAAEVSRFYDATAWLNGERLDVTTFSASVTSWFQKFPDFSATVEEAITVDDRVVTRVTYRGTHLGTWAGLPATGRSFTSLGLDIFQIRDGSIVEHWHATDHYELIDQLGGRVIPSDAPD